MSERRVHFINPVRNVIACGQQPVRLTNAPPDHVAMTRVPAEVTCTPCKRTIAYRAALPSLEL